MALIYAFDDGKGKLWYLNGKIKPSAADDPKYLQWWLENLMVTAWLINSMEPTLGKLFMFMPHVYDVWEAVGGTSSDLENHSQLFEINTWMWLLQQVDKDETTYCNDLMILWSELDMFEVKYGRVWMIALDTRKRSSEVECSCLWQV